jgi:hypothetical protein
MAKHEMTTSQNRDAIEKETMIYAVTKVVGQLLEE